MYRQQWILYTIYKKMYIQFDIINLYQKQILNVFISSVPTSLTYVLSSWKLDAGLGYNSVPMVLANFGSFSLLLGYRLWPLSSWVVCSRYNRNASSVQRISTSSTLLLVFVLFCPLCLIGIFYQCMRTSPYARLYVYARRIVRVYCAYVCLYLFVHCASIEFCIKVMVRVYMPDMNVASRYNEQLIHQ